MALRDPEARKAWMYAYYRRNREKYLAARRKYYSENRERCRAEAKVYRQRHRRKYLEYSRQRSKSLPRGADRSLEDFKRQILYTLKDRSRKRGLEFNLTVEDLDIPKFCPVLGYGLKLGTRRGGNDCSPSVDRIDSSKGYVRGNIQILSNLANAMKRNATPEQLRQFAQWVLRTEGD